MANKTTWLSRLLLRLARSLTWDTFRFGSGVFFIGYSMFFFYASSGISDLNLKLGVSGIGIAIFGVGLSVLSSIASNVEIRKLQDMISQLK